MSFLRRKESASGDQKELHFVPLLHRQALEFFLFFGSEQMAYHALRNFSRIPERLLPDISSLLKVYGVVPPANLRPNPELPELDQLYSKYLHTPQVLDPRLDIQNQDIQSATVRHAATVLFLKHPKTSEYYVGRDKLRGNDDAASPRWTFPMTYSDRNEAARVSVIRVIQQEVLPHLTASGLFHVMSQRAKEFVPEDISPLLELYQFNTVVKAYELGLPKELLDAVSISNGISRLEDPGFTDLIPHAKKDPLDPRFRLGFIDLVKIKTECFPDGRKDPIEERFMSTLNQKIRGDQPLPYGYVPVPF